MNMRYYVEHIAFYNLYAKDPVRVISKLLTEKEEFFYNYVLKVYEENKEACPFQQHDYTVSISQYDQLEFITIDMPKSFMEPSLCHKIILAYSMNLDLYQYFTIEDGNDPVFGHYQVLGGWIEGNHYSFGTILESDKLEEKIYNVAMV